MQNEMNSVQEVLDTRENAMTIHDWYHKIFIHWYVHFHFNHLAK